MIKDMFQDDPWLAAFFSLCILFIIFLFVDYFFSKPIEFSGIVIDKQYKAESTSVGTGVVNSSNGSGVVTTVQTDPEKFLLMVKTATGNILTAECEPELYYSKQQGQHIDCYISKGFFTGWQWSVHGIR